MNMNIPQEWHATKAQIKRLRHYFGQGIRAYRYQPDDIHLDLLGFKLIEMTPHGSGSSHHVQLTPKALDVLHKHRQASIARQSTHNGLGARVAAYLRKQGRITWENVEFRHLANSKAIPNSSERLDMTHFQCVRPDVFSILPALQQKSAKPCIHEVKVSRADFLSDLAKPDKWGAYAAMSEATYYVAPEHVIDPSEVPAGFGLLVERSEGVFVLAKRAKRRNVQLQPHHYLNMIIKPGCFPDE